jgi:hypothetical protein
MSTLRAISVVYLLCALAFGIAMVFDRDPLLEQASRRTVALGLDAVRGRVIKPFIALTDRGAGQAFAATQHAANGVVAMVEDALTSAPQAPAPRRVARADKPIHLVIHRPAYVAPVAREPDLQTPTAPVVTPPDIAIADAAPPTPVAAPAALPAPVAPPKPQFALAPPPPSSGAVSPGEIVRVSERLKENLTREMLDNFSLFLYVSKADNGPWAQHMYVFRKETSGNLSMLYTWPVSTGREKVEMAANGTRQPSYTPQGYYQLDPGRMYKTHFSGQWHEPMPHAMFFNWENQGLQTGLAIHGAVGLEIAQLGSRASAGCIRLAPQNAALLFNLIRTQYKGLAPRFAFDRRTATMSNDGVLMHDAGGNLKLADGYKVLVFVENYGGENVVAALF